jgi:hypothetical protein
MLNPGPGKRGRVCVRRPEAGFDATKPYTFEPFTPTLPNSLGEFHSLKG